MVEQVGSVDAELTATFDALPKWGVERSGIQAMFSLLLQLHYSAHEHAE